MFKRNELDSVVLTVEGKAWNGQHVISVKVTNQIQRSENTHPTSYDSETLHSIKKLLHAAVSFSTVDLVTIKLLDFAGEQSHPNSSLPHEVYELYRKPRKLEALQCHSMPYHFT